MPRLVFALALAAALGASSSASAGAFGGFSEDRGTYLNGDAQVCTPLEVSEVDSAAAARCIRGETGSIAAAKYRKGKRQSGASGFRADGRGTRIHLLAPGGDEPLVRWNAGGVVSRIVAVYAVDDGAVVAVEFETRRFGRMETDAIAFRLRKAEVAVDPDAAKADPDAIDEVATERKAADALARKRKWKRAEAAYRKVLALSAADPAARYGLAVALARRNKLNESLRELQALAKTRASDDRAIIWLFEARSNKAFRKLRKRKEFRRAVGLERAEGEVLTAYERLLEPPKGWERPRLACEEAGVALRLKRKKHKFQLVITSECQGDEEKLRLDGGWRAQGTAYLILTFPNVDGPDETTRCEIRSCSDGAGEDCLSCQVDRDIGFTLRPIRR